MENFKPLASFPINTRRKNVPRELFKELETTTYKILILSLLFGMTHVKEKEEQKLFFDHDFDATFEEAVEFMKEKLSLKPEEFYELDAKARFRAFTVAKLTGLDAIERVKEKLLKAIEEGKTLKEWIEELGEDGILKAVGFHQSNPWYLETVFRTNISTAYNAGRFMQFARSKDKIKYLEYVAIDDGRTTPICKRLDGTKLPPDDPFWATYTPPNHFNCRSTVRAIFKGSNEAGKVRKRAPRDLPELPEGFRSSPLSSWWKLIDSMARRVVKYGLKDEILEKAKKLCQKNLSDDWCEEYKEVERYLRDAEEIVEKQQKAEKEFLKVLKEFDVEKPEESFKKLWVSERTYQNHLRDRLDEGVISGWKDYLEKTLETLALYSGVYYEVYSESWDRILYDRKRQWMVVLTEKGRIISSMKVNEKLKELFDRHIQKAKRDKQTLEIHRGKTNEELKGEAEGVLKALRGKK
ncbi:phage head morphogenesis protein [Thermovibrio ammonificans]